MVGLDQLINLEDRVTTIRTEIAGPGIPMRVVRSGLPPRCWAVLYCRANDCREFEISEVDYAFLHSQGVQEGP